MKNYDGAIADLAFWKTKLTDDQLWQLKSPFKIFKRGLQPMTEIECYNRLYDGMAMLVPHYKWRHWHHVAVTHQDGETKTFLDGKEDNTGEIKVLVDGEEAVSFGGSKPLEKFTVSFWHKRNPKGENEK